MFLSIGLRPFFLLAGLYGCLAMALWLAWIGAGVSPFPAAPATAPIANVIWHGHEMLFGFAAAVIAGFLLTAVPNWTGAAPLSGAPLAALACLWIAGRLAIWLSDMLPTIAVAIADLAFLPALGIAVAVPLVRARVFRNIVFLALLAVLFAANLVVHLDIMGWTGANAGAGNLLGLNLVVLLITIVGGRVVPAFTANWLKAEGIKATVHRRPPLDALTIAATAAVLVAELAAAADAVTGALALVAAVLHLVRLAGWQTRRVLGAPIMWILHVGYGWLTIGFALKALALLSDVIAPASAVHALSVGAVGSMTLGVMSRAALGHTGRALRVATAITVAYVLVSLAALLRIAGPAVLPAATAETIAASGISWVFAFGIFTWVYWPILTRPPLEE
jgi:uncharacterized protein involved in response to NO